MYTSAVVFAAGRSTRMKSDVSKVLLELNGKPIIHYIIQTLLNLEIAEIVAVVGHQEANVCHAIQQVSKSRVRFATQNDLHGTGDALRVACEHLSDDISSVLIVNGDDSAFYTTTTLSKLISFHESSASTITALFAPAGSSVGFRRLHRHNDGRIEFLSYEQMLERGLTLPLVSTGAYVMAFQWLIANVNKIPISENGEFKISTLIYMAQDQNQPINIMALESPNEWISINTPEEYLKARANMANKQTLKENS